MGRPTRLRPRKKVRTDRDDRAHLVKRAVTIDPGARIDASRKATTDLRAEATATVATTDLRVAAIEAAREIRADLGVQVAHAEPADLEVRAVREVVQVEQAALADDRKVRADQAAVVIARRDAEKAIKQFKNQG